MAIDPKSLPPRYQAQFAAQKPRKYHNTPTVRGNIRFDSKREAERYDELMLLLKAGKIQDLKLQPEFTLQEAYTLPDGKRVRAIRYRADFSYKLPSNRYVQDGPEHGVVRFKQLTEWYDVVEDVKSKATKTREYKLKKKLLRERFGVEIQEV